MDRVFFIIIISLLGEGGRCVWVTRQLLETIRLFTLFLVSQIIGLFLVFSRNYSYPRTHMCSARLLLLLCVWMLLIRITLNKKN